ncbi:ATP-binding protein [Leuconostoc citreum]|uniref:ATP-binding protein n=1 Tax=Leuconostoc citreum TaxID=33964 RepID=UPI000ED43FDD|nr:ATP-binding protein [Leuconostoc citreum]MCJ2167887.1 ATP-binding protein [Leuconostoc citreum]MCT3055215.1 ATP-binding protein [Leuconostoc citreum]MCT3056374.1 ATP-binding protein [Leuconostoc citreum]MCT3060743.1 ATP-binding protein [Leuconostoc citreum]MCT3062824.1 ATP-binding protein [Leuconostoc citreum]
MQIDHFAEAFDASQPLSIDANSLLAHHLLITGATGSGKSTSLLRLVECLRDKKQATIIFDPTGEYQTAGHVVRYKLGENASIDVSQLTAMEITKLLGDHEGEFVDRFESAITALQIQKQVVKQPGIYNKINRTQVSYRNDKSQLKFCGHDYDTSQLINQLIQEFIVPYADHQADYNLLGQTLDYQVIQRHWSKILAMQEQLSSPNLAGLFKHEQVNAQQPQTDMSYVLKLFATRKSQATLVIDVSMLMKHGAQSRLVLSILLRELLTMRTTSDARFPLTIFLDEAHRFLPNNNDTLSDSGLFKLIREGRKYGLYVVLSTQSPLDLPVKLSGQFGSLLIHQLNNQAEVTSLLNNQAEQVAAYQKLSPGQGLLKIDGTTVVHPVCVAIPNALHSTDSPKFS